MEMRSPARLLKGCAINLEQAFDACAAKFMEVRFEEFNGDGYKLRGELKKLYTEGFARALEEMQEELARVERAAALFNEPS